MERFIVIMLCLVLSNGESRSMSPLAQSTNADDSMTMDINRITPVAESTEHSQEFDIVGTFSDLTEITSKQSVFSSNTPNISTTDCNIPLNSSLPVSQNSSKIIERLNMQQSTQLVSTETLQTVRFIIRMFLLPLVAILGCACNTFNIFILTRKSMSNSTNYYLTALGVLDLCSLLVDIWNWIFYMIEYFNPQLYVHVMMGLKAPIIGNWLGLASGRSSNMFILLLSIERFTAVKFPLTAKLSPLSRHPIRTIAAIIISITAMLIPNLFQTEYGTAVEESTNATVIILTKTKYYHLSPMFFTVYVYFLLITLRFVPVFFVLLLNICIIVTLKHSRKSTAGLQASNSDMREKEQMKITRMLIVVAIIFLLCVTPGLIHSFMANFLASYNSGSRYGNLWGIFHSVFTLMDALNSAVNFFVYVLMSNKYRTICLQAACKKTMDISPTLG